MYPLVLTYIIIIGPVVQLVRMPACHAGGRGFESRPDRHLHIILAIRHMIPENESCFFDL